MHYINNIVVSIHCIVYSDSTVTGMHISLGEVIHSRQCVTTNKYNPFLLLTMYIL